MNDTTLFLIITFVLIISVGLTLILFYKSNGGSGTGIDSCPTIQDAINGDYPGKWILRINSNGREDIISPDSLKNLFGEGYIIQPDANGFKLNDSIIGKDIYFEYKKNKYIATITDDNGNTGTLTLEALVC
jgi:hypothetical protein